MQSPRWFRIIGSLLLGLLWIWLSSDRGGNSSDGYVSSPRKGFLAPDFTLETMDGEEVTLSNLRGQVVILNLWASWCGPCRKEMPTFKEFHEEYREKGVVILAVNSTSQDSVPAVEAFVNEFQLPFTILMDHAGTVSRLYGLQALPTTFFIDRFGMISRVVIGGPLSESTLRAEVDSLLAGGTP